MQVTAREKNSVITDADRVKVMRKVRQLWPATVSELIHEVDAPHVTVFRGLMIAGAIILSPTNAAVMSPTAHYYSTGLYMLFFSHTRLISFICVLAALPLLPS